MGTLRNAQRTLLRAEAIESSDEDEDEDRPQPASAKGKGKEVVEWSAHPKPVIQSRVSKHAYVVNSCEMLLVHTVTFLALLK